MFEALFIIRIISQKLRLLEFNFDEHIDMPWDNSFLDFKKKG
jgi:hypothetical protein